MPGPGHPGHFPKPPGWVDHPGTSRPSASAGSGGASSAGPSADEERSRAEATTGGPPEPSPAATAGESADDRRRTARDEAAARVAELLGREAEEEAAVEEAAEAVEQDIDALAAVQAERDEYLDSLRRLQADFENYKKRIVRQQADVQERAAEKLVEQLLPVLDNFDLALAHADVDAGLEPVHRSLLGVLESAGLERMDPAGQPFDPNEHDAVMHEPGGDAGEPEVLEVLRAGYRWRGRVLRPAMVKVKG